MKDVAARSRAFARVLFLLLFVLTGLGGALAAQTAGHDWTQFGFDPSSSGVSTAPTGITSANITTLSRHQVKLDGTVDASAIFLHDVTIKGAKHNVFFVTTTYGKTIAIDADSGDVLWEYTPPKYSTWAGTNQITNSTPVADLDRQSIYAASPGGAIEKLAVSDGRALWTTPITLLPRREKIASPLHEFHGHIIAVTGGYIGDQPPYQGHVVVLDPAGKVLHVWNSLCSNRSGLLNPSSCPSVQSAIWGRAGAVIDPTTGNILVATGNGQYNGKTDWGDSIIELDPEAARMLGNYTPADNARLNDEDLDLGSTSPVLLGDGLLAQGGKDGLIRVLNLQQIAGTAAHQDHELQSVSTPSGAMLFTAPAVWRDGGKTWMFAADLHGTAAWTLENRKLVQKWKNGNGGTSPIVAGGLLYIYDPSGGLRVYQPTTGKQVAYLPCGDGHFNSPIVVGGRIALPEGNANHHATSGVFNIWSLPPKH
jgi:outer membrane protein assembly factor BamB